MWRFTPVVVLGLLLAAACGNGADDEPPSITSSSITPSASVTTVATTTTATAAKTTSTTSTPMTSPEGEVIPPPVEAIAGSLLELMHSIPLPWTWNGWAIEPYDRYESTWVTHHGEFVFSLEMYGHERVLPAGGDQLREEEIVGLWQYHMTDPGFDGQRNDYSHTIEGVQFLDRPALLSVWVTPAQGPAERIFIELFFQTGERPVLLAASSDEWDTIDPEAVAAFLPVFKHFLNEYEQR